MQQTTAKEGIRLLFDEFANEIYRYALFTLHDDAEAKDVVQEVFFRAFKQWESFRHESSYKTWLLSIARNYMYDVLRRRKTREKYLDQLPSPSENLPGDFQDDMIVLRESLAALKDSYRQVIVLRHIEDLPVNEVAGILGWTEGKVRTTLHRALKRLREFMEERG
ncbi:sigma-70 family RNA polymerase sigma factor [Tumebacillus sp. ITR2]|uniref:Sigma-70 family RNA polymerase sigma factor n=1 Tax=Tumebacillus amylolyticus TaxID=2801339 RepID=A0ABS1JEC8_9BACL|nr:sigma-70 family RNA polymerase sigma factor [Tumebacillus amylolyticus]MBL0388646.1 sigma-70 family RNA polymerase sigma factor [Tumebacillus amylolyticus]